MGNLEDDLEQQSVILLLPGRKIVEFTTRHSLDGLVVTQAGLTKLEAKSAVSGTRISSKSRSWQ